MVNSQSIKIIYILKRIKDPDSTLVPAMILNNIYFSSKKYKSQGVEFFHINKPDQKIDSTLDPQRGFYVTNFEILGHFYNNSKLFRLINDT